MSTKVSSVRVTKRTGSFSAKRRTVCDNSLMFTARGHFDPMPIVPNRPRRVWVVRSQRDAWCAVTASRFDVKSGQCFYA